MAFSHDTARRLLSLFFIAGALSANAAEPAPRELRLLLDQPPLTLNPRSAIDASAQRINALLFRALTRLDADLAPRPDLAERWEISADGRTWKFRIRTDLRDHAGHPITAEHLARCLEEYRAGKPVSPLKAGIPNWKANRSEGGDLVIELEKPDPYLARNLSAYRYFTSDSAKPCGEPVRPGSMVSSGLYKPASPRTWASPGSGDLILVPQAANRAPLRIRFARDETSRAMKLLRDEADGVQNGMSLTKTRWLQREHAKRFTVLERAGSTVSYLAFNMKDPVLSKKKVREALVRAIDRESIVRNKLMGFGTLAESLLAPSLPESHAVALGFDPAASERLLDEAGYPRGKDGVRLRLRYKTTPVREGLETALLFQDMFRKIGVELTLDVVEPALFLANVNKGNFQLYSSRWIGVADGSILYRTLRSGERNNRVSYQNAEMDRLLDQAMAEVDTGKRIALLRTVQIRMAEDLPYFPLWYWTNALILRNELASGIKGRELSLSGGLEPLTRIKP